MKKIITLLTISALFVFGATAMAADADKANGFYDIGENEKVEMTVFSGDAEVSATAKDVDGDGEQNSGTKTLIKLELNT